MPNEDVRPVLIKLIGALDKAISYEYNAMRFYSNAAREIKSDPCRRIFEWLAEFEENHFKSLVKKRNEMARHPSISKSLKVPDFDRDLAETGSEFRMDICLPGSEMLRTAIKNEKRMYAFYTKKSLMAIDDSLKAMLLRFADEEDRHMNILKRLLHMLDVGEESSKLDLKKMLN